MADDFVAYHSTRVMGRAYRPVTGEFAFFSRKSHSFLQKVIGGEVWAITGTQGASRRVSYHLAAVFTADDVLERGDACSVTGSGGHIFRPAILLNALPWFEVLVREQNNFSFGLSRIRDPGVREALHGLLPPRHRGGRP
jgi:hypothetical protein